MLKLWHELNACEDSNTYLVKLPEIYCDPAILCDLVVFLARHSDVAHQV